MIKAHFLKNKNPKRHTKKHVMLGGVKLIL